MFNLFKKETEKPDINTDMIFALCILLKVDPKEFSEMVLDKKTMAKYVLRLHEATLSTARENLEKINEE